MRPVPERLAAKAAQQPTYNTGKPCKNGHLSNRRTSTGNCIECDRAKGNRFRATGKMTPERTAAKERGDTHYDAGKPCKNGHRALCWTASGLCTICAIARVARWKKARPGYEATYKRDYRKRKPHKQKEADKRYREKHPEKRRQNDINWRNANREYWRAYMAVYAQNRRARKAKNGGFYTVDDVAILREKQKGCCAGCGTDKKKLEVDHIVPVIKSGSNDPSNLQLLCGPCNKSKGAKDADEWIRSRNCILRDH